MESNQLWLEFNPSRGGLTNHPFHCYDCTWYKDKCTNPNFVTSKITNQHFSQCKWTFEHSRYKDVKTQVQFPTPLTVYTLDDVLIYCEERGCDEETLMHIDDLISCNEIYDCWSTLERNTNCLRSDEAFKLFDLLISLGFKEPIHIRTVL